jgi:hypothetical protein
MAVHVDSSELRIQNGQSGSGEPWLEVALPQKVATPQTAINIFNPVHDHTIFEFTPNNQAIRDRSVAPRYN